MTGTIIKKLDFDYWRSERQETLMSPRPRSGLASSRSGSENAPRG